MVAHLNKTGELIARVNMPELVSRTTEHEKAKSGLFLFIRATKHFQDVLNRDQLALFVHIGDELAPKMPRGFSSAIRQ